MNLEQLLNECLLLEDTPKNYVDQLVSKILLHRTTDYQNEHNIPYVEFNKFRKTIETKRVDNQGKPLTKQQFIDQGLSYFDRRYPELRKFRNVVSRALDNYY